MAEKKARRGTRSLSGWRGISRRTTPLGARRLALFHARGISAFPHPRSQGYCGKKRCVTDK